MINYDELSAEDRIIRAKLQMYNKSPFFSYILLHMNFEEMSEEEKQMLGAMHGEATMSVDPNGNCRWTESFVKKLKEEELTGVLAHEVMHIALLHLERSGTRHRQLLNICQDLVINDIIKTQFTEDHSEIFQLPKEGCIPDSDHKFRLGKIVVSKINEKSAEEIYDELLTKLPQDKNPNSSKCNAGFPQGPGGNKKGQGQGKKKEQGSGNKGNGSGNQQQQQQGSGGQGQMDDRDSIIDGLPKTMDKHIYGDNMKKSESQSQNQKWKRVISEAATCAKQQGKLPAYLERLLGDILDSKINWKEKLYRYVIPFIPFDYSWSRPGRKSAGAGVYLPSIMKESVQIAFHVDTSGSMLSTELSQALGEMQSIMNSFQNVRIDVLIGDAEMQHTATLTSDNKEEIVALAKNMKGGGGTDHQYVFKHMLENMNNVRLLICFTDGYTTWPDKKKIDTLSFNTLVILTKHSCSVKEVPSQFETIKIDDREE